MTGVQTCALPISTVLAAATVMALVEGRWFAALGSAGLTVLIGSGTRP